MTQDVFISNRDHVDPLYSKVNQECCSSNQTLADKCKDGNFLNTLGPFIGQLKAECCLLSSYHSSSIRD